MAPASRLSGSGAAGRPRYLLKGTENMTSNEEQLLQRIADTLDKMLEEMQQANMRHQELDQSKADAEAATRDRYKNL